MITNTREDLFESFSKQAISNSNNIAIKYKQEEITYRELNERVEELRKCLDKSGISKNNKILIGSQNPLETVICILGVLFSGMDFVVVKTNEFSEKDKLNYNDNITNYEISYNMSSRKTKLKENTNLSDQIKNEVDTYFVFLSENLANWIYFNVIKLKINFNTMNFISSGSSESTFPIWIASLIIGGKVNFYHDEELKKESPIISDGKSLVIPLEIIKRFDNFSLKRLLNQDTENLITIGSDTFNPEVLNSFINKSKVNWYNYFGFPEMYILTKIVEDNSSEIYYHKGLPIHKTKAFILDRDINPLGINMEGDLYVTGKVSVDFTDITDHKTELDNWIANNIVNKTGYTAKWLPEGKIAFTQNNNHMIKSEKIKSMAKEIEKQILKQSFVKDCAVIVNNRTQNFTAHIVFQENVQVREVTAELKKNILIEKNQKLDLIKMLSLPYLEDGTVDKLSLSKLNYFNTDEVVKLETEIKNECLLQDILIYESEYFEEKEPLQLEELILRRSESNANKHNALGKNTVLYSDYSIMHGGELRIEKEDPNTLSDLLIRAATEEPNKGITYIDSYGKSVFQSYPSLLRVSKRILSGLRSSGIKPMDKVILLLKEKQDFIPGFWACILGGYIPVPLSTYLDKISEFEQFNRVWHFLDNPTILTDAKLEQKLNSTIHSKELEIKNIDVLREYKPTTMLHSSNPEDLAVLLFTSGSTGNPKGVMQTHQNIILREKGTTIYNHFSNKDISLNWLPLEHVGGLIMFHLRDVYNRCEQIQVSTEYVLSNPLNWIELISTYKATATWAPNFAYALVNEKLKGKSGFKWNLSSMRFILNGGETINPNTAKMFLKLLEPYYLKDTIMYPSWGMAETCSGIIYSKKFSSKSFDGIQVLDNNFYKIEESSISKNKDTNLTFTEVGKPIPGISVRIIDNNHNILREGCVGRVQIKGTCVTPGYFRNEDFNTEAFTADGWFNTGDLGIIINGNLMITGREKEVIIINGVNISSSDIENFIEDIDGILATYTAACAIRDDNDDTEGIAIFFCSEYKEKEDIINQINEIQKQVIERFKIAVDYIIPVDKEDIPKTSIGKIQRNKLSSLIKQGYFKETINDFRSHLKNKKVVPSWFYEKIWQNRKIKERSLENNNRKCIIFEDELNLGKSLLMRIRKKENCLCISVKSGTSFIKHSRLSYEIDYQKTGDYLRLFRSLLDDGIEIDDVFFLRSYYVLDRTFDTQYLKEANNLGIFSLLNLLKSIKLEFEMRDLRIFVVTNGAKLVKDTDWLDVSKSTISGFVKSAQLELPWRFSHIDLEDLDIELNTEVLYDEWQNSILDKEVVYRGKKRYVPQLKHLNIVENKKELPIKKGGIYLITGGLGGLGSKVAELLIKEYQAKILIIGRTNFEDCQDTSLTNNSRYINYKNLKMLSDDIIYKSGDISEYKFLRKSINEVESYWGEELSGVFHLAGVGNLETHWKEIDNHWITSEKTDTYEYMFNPKVYGTLNIHKCIKDNPSCLFVGFSSVSSFFGAATFSAYSAANSFLEEFCQYRNKKGYLNTYCLNWSTWDNIGMSRNNASEMINSMKARGYELISHREGLFSLLVALCSDKKIITIGLNDSIESIKSIIEDNSKSKQQLINIYYSARNNTLDKKINESITKTLSRYKFSKDFIVKAYKLDSISNDFLIDTDDLINNKEVFNSNLPSDYLEKRILDIWRDLLQNNNININDNFFKLGGHSLKAANLISEIQNELDIQLSIGDVFKSPTVKELSSKIRKEKEVDNKEIGPIEKRNYYPLSSTQKRLFVIEQINKNAINYNIPSAFIIEGPFSYSKIESTFQKLINRHESLRTSFEMINDEPVQIISNNAELKIDYWEYKGSDYSSLLKKFVIPFDLKKAPLLRVALLKIGNNKHLMMLDMHHIIADGKSIAVFIKDFIGLYEGKALKELNIQFKDFAEWQNKLLKSDYIKRQEKYWLNKFSGDLPVLNIKQDYPRGFLESKGERINFTLEEKFVRKLYDLCFETGTTPYILLLASYTLLLSKYSGHEDILVGTPVEGRLHKDLENIIGVFVNTLVMRNFPVSDMSFLAFLEKVKENSLEAFENQEYQFEQIVDNLNIKRTLERNPFFDFMFVLQNTEIPEIEINDLKITNLNIESKSTKADMALFAYEKDSNMHFYLQYNSGLYKRKTAEKFVSNFLNILTQILDNPKQILTQINLEQLEETGHLIKENNKSVDISGKYKSETIYRLFEKQANETPQSIAVVYKNKKLTYQELNEKSNRLARMLKSNGTKNGEVIAISAEPSVDLIITIMGILKAKCAYLPLDKTIPQERLKFILKESKVRFVMGIDMDQEYVNQSKLINLSVGDSLPFNHSNLSGEGTGQDLAYIVYTSGSTGEPKGVMIEHKGLVNYCNWFNKYTNLCPIDKSIILTSLAFDLSYTGLYTSLTSGGEVHLIDQETVLQTSKLTEYIKFNEITFLKATPSLFRSIIETLDTVDKDRFSKVRLIILGGESINLNDIKKYNQFSNNTVFMNHYGPAEATIGSVACIVDSKKPLGFINSSIIGRPINNTDVYILDKHSNPVPIGEIGEIHIGGRGLARGYVNKELNSVKFINKKFSDNVRLFKTGDIGRYLVDGTLEYLGRMDDQIKIRGYRIELEEIRKCVLTVEGITAAIVTVIEDDELNLCCYYVAKDVEQPSIFEKLKGYLPNYMIPSFFVRLEKLPITVNGKVDKRALPKPIEQDNITNIKLPRNEIEVRLLEFWKKILKTNQEISIHDNFFNLGGHSLRVVLLASKILKEFNVEVSIEKIFTSPTIAQLAEYIQKYQATNYFKKITSAEPRDYYPVSSAQKRMYILNELYEGNKYFNMPSVFLIEGNIDKHEIEKAINVLVRRHEVLRTTFHFKEDMLVQKIVNDLNIFIEYKEIEEKQIESAISEFVKPFNLQKGPLLRVGLVKQKESLDKYYLLIDIHHIICDGITRRILFRELSIILNNKVLSKLSLQYKDFTVWQHDLLQSEEFKKQEHYWTNVLRGDLPQLNIPSDYERPNYKQFEGKSEIGIIDRETTSKLIDLANENKSTLFILFMAIFNTFLYKYTGNDDIIIGTPIAGRNHPDLENVAGMFVNTLAMRNFPSGDKKFNNFLIEVRENSIQAFNNKDFQFDDLVEKLIKDRDLSRSPIFDVMLNVLNFEEEDINIEGVNIANMYSKNEVSNYDMTLQIREINESLEYKIQYNASIFNNERIKNIIVYIRSIINQITEDCNIELQDIKLFGEDDIIRKEIDNKIYQEIADFDW